ncbi:hypothetical protein M427DRAFT_49042 [Gonapodya prolifera JEL478]|uniref:Uncharacterized protein n=1 Tax=Gonapodya prolifera (strain JEL478) TaxID=1344416 RepID=A0A138ZZD6_GONPJ|nr:hypothetical protein M427DRAFT_49042 [Gonapodya prolifera JEL478]|eukprot:KXS09869.1 hypothetical protein M427DRAFT_49042 [Gonapodya prolifera JEL478]
MVRLGHSMLAVTLLAAASFGVLVVLPRLDEESRLFSNPSKQYSASLHDPAFPESAIACWGDPRDHPPCPFDHRHFPLPEELFQPASRREDSRLHINQSVPGFKIWPGRSTPERKLRVLYYTSWDLYSGASGCDANPFFISSLSSRSICPAGSGTFSVQELLATARHPYLDIRLWGPGFPQYDSHASLRENLERGKVDGFGAKHDSEGLTLDAKIGPWESPSSFVDIIYAVGIPLEEAVGDAVVQVQAAGGCGILSHSTRTSASEMDVSVPSQVDQPCVTSTVRHTNFSSVLSFSSARELFIEWNWDSLVERGVDDLGRLWAHDPECLDTQVMFPLPVGRLPTRSAMLFRQSSGKQLSSPFERGVAAAFEKGLLTGEIFSYKPASLPYPSSSLLELAPGTIDPEDPLVHHILQPTYNLADSFRTTLVCLFPASIVWYRPSLLLAAALSGCIVATDAHPSLIPDPLTGSAVVFPPDASAEYIARTLTSLASDPQEVAKRRVRAFVEVRKVATCDAKGDRLVEWARMVRRGEAGHWFGEGLGHVW